MDAFSSAAGNADEAFGAEPRGFGIAPYGMAGGVAGDLFARTLAQAEFILAVEGGAAASLRQNACHPLIILDEQFTGGRAHENLDAGAARQLLEGGEIGHIFPGATHVKSEIAIHAVAGAADLVGQGCGGHGKRLGIGHFENAGDAAHDRGAAAGFQVFLVFKAGLAEMHLAVDDAGENVQAPAIQGFGGGERTDIAYPHDTAFGNGQTGGRHPIMIDQGSPRHNEISPAFHPDSLIVAQSNRKWC